MICWFKMNVWKPVLWFHEDVDLMTIKKLSKYFQEIIFVTGLERFCVSSCIVVHSEAGKALFRSAHTTTERRKASLPTFHGLQLFNWSRPQSKQAPVSTLLIRCVDVVLNQSHQQQQPHRFISPATSGYGSSTGRQRLVPTSTTKTTADLVKDIGLLLCKELKYCSNSILIQIWYDFKRSRTPGISDIHREMSK